MTAKRKVGILISGRGSNMQSLARAMATPNFPAEPAVVISNRPEAEGLDWAAERGIPTVAIDHKAFATRMAFEARLHQSLLDHGVDLICNAGFMRMLTGSFVDRWRDRQLNIHPSLLPAFPGLETHERVLQQGILITGCTVHFIRTEMDAGPIIAQAAVAVLPSDTPETLGARVLKAEHKLYPLALRLVASGQATVENETVKFTLEPQEPMPLFVPASNLTTLG
ncbi:MAG: phosphoribosylglycinamide formyltransferase [Hyphomicrobiaceae bacterium]